MELLPSKNPNNPHVCVTKSGPRPPDTPTAIKKEIIGHAEAVRVIMYKAVADNKVDCVVVDSLVKKINDGLVEMSTLNVIGWDKCILLMQLVVDINKELKPGGDFMFVLKISNKFIDVMYGISL